jgi:hypothetical protein
VTKTQFSRWQAFAALLREHQEEKIEAAKMTEQQEPIPQSVADAFREAIARCADWSPPNREIELRIGNVSNSMSAVCGFADKFDDDLPDDVFGQLRSYMLIRYRALGERLGEKRTYSVGSYCLLRLIEGCKAAYAMRMCMRNPS